MELAKPKDLPGDLFSENRENEIRHGKACLFFYPSNRARARGFHKKHRKRNKWKDIGKLFPLQILLNTRK